MYSHVVPHEALVTQRKMRSKNKKYIWINFTLRPGIRYYFQPKLYKHVIDAEYTGEFNLLIRAAIGMKNDCSTSGIVIMENL